MAGSEDCAVSGTSVSSEMAAPAPSPIVIKEESLEYRQWRKMFENFIDTCYSPGREKTKIIRRSKAEQIKRVLRNEPGMRDAQRSFYYWAKGKNFQIRNYPALGLKNVLCLPTHIHKKYREKGEQFIPKGNWRVVALVENFWDILMRIHSTEGNHIGMKKTLEEVRRHYECLPRTASDKFVELCLICAKRKENKHGGLIRMKSTMNSSPQTAPIYLARAMAGIIDMQDMPDGEFRFIGQYIDMFSKYRTLFAMTTNSKEEVAGNIRKVLMMLGKPHILQVGPNREFSRNVIELIQSSWAGDIQIINGRPADGCSVWFEEECETVASMIQTRIQETGDTGWSSGIDDICYQLNQTRSDEDGLSPFETIFGQYKNELFTVVPSVDNAVVSEEDLERFLSGEKETGGPKSSDMTTQTEPIECLCLQHTDSQSDNKLTYK